MWGDCTTYNYSATLVRCIDGDSVVLDVDLGFKLHRQHDSYRLGRIDAPEMSTEAGPSSRDALVAMLALSSSLMVTTSTADKYGRGLVELFADGVNLNDRMVAEGFAVYRTY